jgi:RNA polymerase sigma-70 factor (ECF subfamily)
MGAAAELVIDENAGGPEAVVDEHRRMVYRIAYSVLRNHHDAEDAMQEALLRLLRAKMERLLAHHKGTKARRGTK